MALYVSIGYRIVRQQTVKGQRVVHSLTIRPCSEDVMDIYDMTFTEMQQRCYNAVAASNIFFFCCRYCCCW